MSVYNAPVYSDADSAGIRTVRDRYDVTATDPHEAIIRGRPEGVSPPGTRQEAGDDIRELPLGKNGNQAIEMGSSAYGSLENGPRPNLPTGQG